MSSVIWFTGPTGVGKTVLSRALREKLREKGCKVEILDGDEVRRKLYPEIGYIKKTRKMHNKVVINVVKLLSRTV